MLINYDKRRGKQEYGQASISLSKLKSNHRQDRMKISHSNRTIELIIAFVQPSLMSRLHTHTN